MSQQDSRSTCLNGTLCSTDMLRSEGITSNNDGSLVIKPCTQAEIDFYQAAQTNHRALQAHMPEFMGVLALSPDQTAPADGIGPALQVHQEIPSALAVHVPQGWLPSHLTPSSLPSPISSKRTSWKPSGGKMLETSHAIVLENVADRFLYPNIIDIKLGSRLWADDAPESKRRKLDEVAKDTTSGSLGFRIAGMKRWVGSVDDRTKTELVTNKGDGIEYKDGFLCYNKQYGRGFTKYDVKEGFIEYFGGLALTGERTGKFQRIHMAYTLSRLVRELESVLFTLSEEETRMYSASVLIVCEGDEISVDIAHAYDERRMFAQSKGQLDKAYGREFGTSIDSVEDGGEDGEDGEDEDGDEDGDEDEDPEGNPKLYDLRLIDFAHAAFTPGKGPDENVRGGVRSLIEIFKDLEQYVVKIKPVEENEDMWMN